MSAATYTWVTRDVTRRATGKTHKQRFRVRDRSAEPAKPAPLRHTTKDGHHWIEREVKRANGKTHKQWFRVKAPPTMLAYQSPSGAKTSAGPAEVRADKPRQAEPTKPKASPVLGAKERRAVVEELTKSLPREDLVNVGLPRDKYTEHQKDADAKYKRLEEPEKDAMSAFTAGGYEVMRAVQQGHTVDKLVAKYEFDLKNPPETKAGEGNPKLSPQQVAAYSADYRKDAVRYAKQVPALNTAQEKMSSADPTKDGPLFRGMKVDLTTLHKLLTSDHIEYKADSNSTSYNTMVAKGFAATYGEAGKYSVIIKHDTVRKAANAMFDANGNKHEQEMIVGKQKFRVKKRTLMEGQPTAYVLHVEEE